MAIVIGSNFGYTVLAAVGIAAQCFAAAMSVNGARKKYNVQFPDNGGGRYSDKLSDEDWVAFNNVKRASDNYLEQVGMVLVMLTMAGLYQPKLAASFGASYILGRFFYARGYVAAGAKGRIHGAPIMGLSFIALVITAAYNAFTTTILA
ncbi:Microsomal glutathione S-transferase 3 [Coemansia sp. RSA 1813]|nr:Microsomal glutathione S-transferase 3 [Coemansia sp. RSA 1646]KAJ1771990.1 Microsomal glutathione S-transferase 3 [Coemansia sp. RSA 1843]KAJ2089762.1 Microsomal glutathione S-transferase 3 [Coemansia sp. RSA 986]KAJ2214234.1 Microsomal glutathione S-transferase 3 [Coemansia sp. RSA 487]KAJ2569651.1 Microsomal glutathione S-transferase 3 [Coemansia sp. RSA 1813]